MRKHHRAEETRLNDSAPTFQQSLHQPPKKYLRPPRIIKQPKESMPHYGKDDTFNER